MGDIVTQLQDQVLSLAAKFYNVVGTLQRDAPPVSLSDSAEETPHSSSTAAEGDVAEMVKLMAGDLMTSFKAIDETVKMMPCDDRSAAEQIAAIAQLQRENDELADELQREVAHASQVMDYVHGIYSCFAKDALRPKD
jgi:hypothetical protein